MHFLRKKNPSLKAPAPQPSMEGVSGKIDKLCKPPTDGNVQKCQDELDGGRVNVPTTADLFICYETGGGECNPIHQNI